MKALLAGLLLCAALALGACEESPGSGAINKACRSDGGAVTIQHFTNEAENDAYLEQCRDGRRVVVE